MSWDISLDYLNLKTIIKTSGFEDVINSSDSGDVHLHCSSWGSYYDETLSFELFYHCQNVERWNHLVTFLHLRKKFFRDTLNLFERSFLVKENVVLHCNFEEVSLFILNLHLNLVPSASFCYNRKAEKKPWNTSNRWIKFGQIEEIFFRINYGIRGQRYWKY